MPGQDKFDFAGVLRRTFATFTRGLGPILAIGFIVYSPYLLIQGLFPDLLLPGPDSWAIYNWLDQFVALFFAPLLTGAVTVEVLERLRGQSSTIVRSIGTAYRSIVPLLLVSLVVAVSMMIGLVPLILPGLVPLVFFSSAIPMCVLESRGVRESLEGSWKLTKGARWQILGLFALVVIAFVILYFPLALLAGALFSHEDSASITLFTSVLVTVGATFAAVLSVVIFSELKEKHERKSPEEILSSLS